MDALILLAQAVAIAALACGCYICIKNWHVSDKSSIERELGSSAPLQPHAERYDPLSDSKVAGEIGIVH